MISDIVTIVGRLALLEIPLLLIAVVTWCIWPRRFGCLMWLIRLVFTGAAFLNGVVVVGWTLILGGW